jgi:hypothetical protein
MAKLNLRSSVVVGGVCLLLICYAMSTRAITITRENLGNNEMVLDSESIKQIKAKLDAIANPPPSTKEVKNVKTSDTPKTVAFMKFLDAHPFTQIGQAEVDKYKVWRPENTIEKMRAIYNKDVTLDLIVKYGSTYEKLKETQSKDDFKAIMLPMIKENQLVNMLYHYAKELPNMKPPTMWPGASQSDINNQNKWYNINKSLTEADASTLGTGPITDQKATPDTVMTDSNPLVQFLLDTTYEYYFPAGPLASVGGGIGGIWTWIAGTFGVLGGLAIVALLVTKFVLKLW